MDPNVVRALQRATVAFVVTFVVGSGVVFAIDGAGDDGAGTAVATGSPANDANGDGQPDAPPAITPDAYLFWMPGGFTDTVGAELPTVRRVRRVAVATAGVAWLTRSLDAEGEVVDAPAAPFMIPLEVTGVDPRSLSFFLPEGEERDLLRSLRPDQVILSNASARLRGVGAGGSLELRPGIELEVIGTLPEVLIGGYEAVVARATAERLGAGTPHYALLRLRAGATPTAERLASDLVEMMSSQIRRPAVEVRLPGETELLRAYDRAPTPLSLKRRFGEFTAYPAGGRLDIDDAWIEGNIEFREVSRLGTLQCHRRTLFLLRKAMNELTTEAPLGDIGPCFAETWATDMAQATLPAALWGASIHLNASLNRPGDPPLIDARIVETMRAWGFRWAGDDAYPDGSLFEWIQPPPRTADETPAPSPTD